MDIHHTTVLTNDQGLTIYYTANKQKRNRAIFSVQGGSGVDIYHHATVKFRAGTRGISLLYIKK